MESSLEKEKILYDSTNFEFDKWYVMPIHGELFDLPNDGKTDIPTEWMIFRLDRAGREGDVIPVNELNDFTYFRAEEICKAHNIIIDDLLRRK